MVAAGKWQNSRNEQILEHDRRLSLQYDVCGGIVPCRTGAGITFSR
jgi:hypothetical protein